MEKHSTPVLSQLPLMPTASCKICGTKKQLLRCAKCKMAFYCGAEHQILDWPMHKDACRLFAKQKNCNRMQQLQQHLAAAVISNTANAHGTPDSWYELVSHVINGSGSGQLNVAATTLESGIAVAQPPPAPVAVILGTNENEILHSKAESVSRINSCGGSDSGYHGNAEANSTTTEQMQFNCEAGDDSDGGHGSGGADANSRPQQLLLGEEQSQLSSPHPQQQQQLIPPQFSNLSHNQIEKSCSLQIGLGDENATGNANERRYEDLCRNIINDMNQYGLSVVDDFLGMEKGLQILNEVHKMYAAGVFRDGQLVNNLADQDLRTIRGDKITWVKGIEPGCSNVGYLINQIDAVICRANSMKNNGKLGNYNIKERTKAMVACYPGSGSHYVMHVDNPNKDGRVITAIYYLNVNWDTKRSGGVLRIFPEHGNSVADIEPKFDRLIFFWSDKRNPHEVQPAHRTRYAITVWYFDANEREAALQRCKYTNNVNATTTSSTTSTTTAAASANTAATTNTNANANANANANRRPITNLNTNKNANTTNSNAASEICT